MHIPKLYKSVSRSSRNLVILIECIVLVLLILDVEFWRGHIFVIGAIDGLVRIVARFQSDRHILYPAHVPNRSWCGQSHNLVASVIVTRRFEIPINLKGGFYSHKQVVGIIRRIFFVSILSTLIPTVYELFICRFNNNSSLRGENPLHSSAIVVKYLDTVQKLVYPSVGDPHVARLQTHKHIHWVVQIVWFDEAERRELVTLIFESFSGLLWQLALLVLHL